MSHAGEHFAPGTYKFTVKSTEEAVTIIRDRLGPTARVISVRAVESTGLKRLFGSPRLEVVAQVDPVDAGNASGDAAGSFDAVSAELATPESGLETAPDVAPRSRLTPFSPSLGLTGLLRRSGITVWDLPSSDLQINRTDRPAFAASIAARRPAPPAPMIRTSYE